MNTSSASTSSAQRPEDENLGLGANLAYGLQHVLTMYGGIIAVPLIIGQAAGLSSADVGLLIAASLFARFVSQQEDSPSMKMVAAMRNQFGGHAVVTEGASKPA